MLHLLKQPRGHSEAFLERYSSLMVWAKSLTKGDSELTEEIVQDAYLHFTQMAPPLEEIKNLDGYLYTLLKNLCLANFRRSARNRLSQLSIFEYDSAEFAFSRLDFRDQEDARDELQRICAFLIVRKRVARSAGVFILRFFHGYFPSEIANILRTSRAAIDVRLLDARKEIKAYLADPEDSKLIVQADSAKEIFQTLPVQSSSNQDEFLQQLRAVIFRSGEGPHRSRSEIRDFYEKGHAMTRAVEWFSHAVSCPPCLDEVNLILGIPLLASRFPTDAIGRQKKTAPRVVSRKEQGV